MTDLLVFKIKKAAIEFWAKHPAKMGLAMSILLFLPVASVMATCIYLSRNQSLGPTLSMIVVALLVMAMFWLLWVLMERFGLNITQSEQHALIDRMPAGTVSTTRRLCKLEALLIEQTQGAEKAAWASQRTLELGTGKAGSQKKRPARL